jgi:hypothetical protein
MKRLRIGNRVTIGWQGQRWSWNHIHECPCHRIIEFAGAYLLIKAQ